MVTNRVISIGGSLIVPDKINVSFLKKIKSIIDDSSDKFNLICGGGITARNYIKAAGNFTDKTDFVGIKSALLNSELVKTLFSSVHKNILVNPKNVREKVCLFEGTKPGHSSDYEAVVVAKELGISEVINLTNIDYVYDKNPKLKSAKPFKNMSWGDFKKIAGDTWTPGLSLPFDPIAAKLAQKNKIRVVIINGNKLINLKKYLLGNDFIGTIIE